MENKRVLRRLYLERSILTVPAFCLLGYLWGYNNRGGLYYVRESVCMMGLVLVFVLGSAWYLVKRMRSDREISFVNALPITKELQMAALIETIFLLAILFTVVGEVQLGCFSRLWPAPGEFVLNIFVKTAAVFCATCIFIWILSHYMLGLGQILLGSLVLAACFGMFCSVGDMFQKIWGVPGNHPLFMGWNFWSVLVSPAQHFNAWRTGNQVVFQMGEFPARYQKLVHVPELTWGMKGIGAMIFMVLTGAVALLCIRRAKKNFQEGDFGAKRLHRPFRDAWKGGLLCIVCILFFGTVGSVYLQTWVDKKLEAPSSELAYIPDINFLNMEKVDVCARDLTGKVSYRGIGIGYHGDFWKYSRYDIRSHMHARIIAIGSVFAGGLAALFMSALRRKGRRRGKIS